MVKSTKDIEYVSARDFVEFGYLQELNRCFLHPLGLALEVTVDWEDEGDLGRFSGVWDYRDDVEGMGYSKGALASKDARVKADNVRRAQAYYTPFRIGLWGAVIQPLEVVAKERE